ncbi:FAD-dependent monooxygenase [Actinomycetes bacterium KLBMP 9797]
MPPTGGYGGNTGVHDAHNLAWKLAHVLDGRAGGALLDTYEQAGTDLSILDIFCRDAVLFTGPDGAAWVPAAAAAAERLGVPLDVCRVGGDVGDPLGEFTKVYGIGLSGATLVRPDGVVAWRARELVQDAGDAIGAALARTLCRS